MCRRDRRQLDVAAFGRVEFSATSESACGKGGTVLHAYGLSGSSEGFQVPKSFDEGPFFHGTTAELSVGEFLAAGHRSNYRPEIVMNLSVRPRPLDAPNTTAPRAKSIGGTLISLDCVEYQLRSRGVRFCRGGPGCSRFLCAGP